MASITYSNDAFEAGEEVYVKDLGTLKNGESVEFSDEWIARYETLHGEGAFKRIPHTDWYDENLVGTMDEPEVEAQTEEPTPLFPSDTTEVIAPVEGGDV